MAELAGLNFHSRWGHHERSNTIVIVNMSYLHAILQNILYRYGLAILEAFVSFVSDSEHIPEVPVLTVGEIQEALHILLQ